MSNKKLTILGIVAATLLVLAIVQSRVSTTQEQKASASAPLIQGLDPDVISKIVLGTGEGAVTLTRGERGFVVTNKDNYPAIVKKINKLITSCIDITTTQLVTSNAANHDDLEVTEEKGKYVVKFFGGDDKMLTGLIIGKAAQGTRGTYVRQLPGDDVYLSINTPWLQVSATDYMEQQLITANRDDIEKVSVAQSDDSYIIARDKGGKITLQDIPDGKQAKNKDYEQVMQAICSLQLSDVKKASEETSSLDFDRLLAYRMKDSTVYTVNVAKDTGATYITLSAAFTDQVKATVQEIKQADEEKLKETEAKLQAKDAAEAFNARHSGWIYEVSSWQGDNLTKAFSDLVEDEPKDEQQNGAQNQPSEQTTQPESPSSAATGS